MTRAQVLKLLQVLYGRDALARYSARGLPKAEREAAHAELLAHIANKPPVAGEPGHDHATWSAWKARRDELWPRANAYRYAVGKVWHSPFGRGMMTDGLGDSWAEAVAAGKIRERVHAATRCGRRRSLKGTTRCERDKGHKGKHRGGRFTWE